MLSPTELTKFHSRIVERFSQLHEELSFSLSASREATLIDQPGRSIQGGGRFRLDQTARTLVLWGSSKAYGSFDAAHIQQRLHDAPGLNGYAVHIDE